MIMHFYIKERSMVRVVRTIRGLVIFVVAISHFRERERERSVCVCVWCVCVCQRKTKDRADSMREKSAHSPRRDSNLYLWDTRPSCFLCVYLISWVEYY